ncbi:hypothetical protein AB5I41_31110 [Sphingomonas sp. MMS24-JH45]
MLLTLGGIGEVERHRAIHFAMQAFQSGSHGSGAAASDGAAPGNGSARS